MNIYELIIVSTSVSLFYFDTLSIRTKLKTLIGFKRHDHVKPFDCLFCTAHHFGLISYLIYFISTGDYNNIWYYLILNYLTAKIIDKIWG